MLYYLSRAAVRNKNVLVRVDFNVPISSGKVRDDFRIRAALPTIRKLLRSGNRIILLSHHSAKGRSLKPLAGHLGKILGSPVVFVKNPFAAKFWQKSFSEKIFLVENLRFWPGEMKEDMSFARKLARLGSFFVNDAFGEAHRRAASVTLLPKLLPSCLGLLFEKELRQLQKVVMRSRRPLVAIFGGAKLETKLPLLKRFIRLADKVAVGGAIADVLLRARGFEVGISSAGATVGRDVKKIAHAKNVILPVDVVAAPSRESKSGKICPMALVKRDQAILDIGPKTRELFNQAVTSAGTIVWNGPLGVIEVSAFQKGTLSVAKALARRQKIVLVGGGDSIAFLDKVGLLKKFKHVSTGGGAMLSYLAGEKLPALAAFKK